MDPDSENRKFQKQLNAGATSLALLGLLSRAKQPMYGYEIAKQLETSAEGKLPMNQGALYPVLRALEQQGSLSSWVEPSTSGPARKYYQITADGRLTLQRWLSSWQRTKRFVDSILEGHHASRPKRSRSQVSRRATKGIGNSSRRPTGGA